MMAAAGYLLFWFLFSCLIILPLIPYMNKDDE